MLKLLKRIPLSALIGCVIFALVQATAELTLPNMTANIIDYGVVEGDIDYIIKTGVMMIGLTILVVIAANFNVLIAAKASHNLGQSIRNDLYTKVLGFSQNSVNKFGSASLITRSSSDVNQVEMTTLMILRMMLISPALMISAIIMAYQNSPELSKIYLFTAPVLIVVIGIILYFATPLFKSMQSKVDNINLVFREGLTGVRVIRAFNKSEFESDRFSAANTDFANTAIKANTYMAILMPALVTVLSFTNIAINWIGADYVSQGIVQVGSIVSYTTYTVIIMMSMMMMSMIFILVPRAQVSAVRINEVLETVEPIESPDNKLSAVKRAQAGHIKFDHVDYRFEGAERNVLTDINFNVNPGETLAIIGGTGSGKSTIANLMLRYYDVANGEVIVQERVVKEYQLENLRDLIGYVPQKANLFSGTIRSNLMFGNDNATDDDLWQALEVAQALDFVRELDKGLDSRVEQGGSNFSGGQKQRLSIARALVKKANIYIFDDSFSALDFATDAKLRGALKPVTQNAATVIIAQRVSTIIDANTIVVLEAGQVVGMGTHDELLATNAVYSEIVESQMKEATE